MKTQFIITDLVTVENRVFSEISPAKYISVPKAPKVKRQPCAWCDCLALTPKLDIMQYGLYGQDICYLVALCSDCLKATVFVYEVQIDGFEVNHE